MIRTVYWQDGAVVMIDQKLLPREERLITCRDYRDVAASIKDLTVRGAPAIGVATALGIALGIYHSKCSSREELEESFRKICEEFSQTRPTARNLFWAIERMNSCLEKQAGTVAEVKEALVSQACLITEEDIAVCRRIGEQGRGLIEEGDRILTHCNAGALACAGYGTALGVIRAAHESGKKIHVYVDETRPVLQGARLTAWELSKERIAATLIADNMAGSLMYRGLVDKVIVGADRIAANGDVANKIGTYSLAVLARENGIPFYVAAPLSTIDMAMKEGGKIPIEERNMEEVLRFGGAPVTVEGMEALNPAFDVTPARYVTAIITEAGVIKPPFSRNLKKIFRQGSPMGL